MDITYYVALPFVPSEDGIAPGEPVECDPKTSTPRSNCRKTATSAFYVSPS